MYKKILISCLLAMTGVFILAFSSTAKGGEWVENEHLRSRLVATAEGGDTAAVLEIELNEGWHTYGQDPGDAGLPPRFNWESSTNVENIEISWPAPIRKREMNMFDVNAYEGEVRFPLSVTPQNEDEDVMLDLDLQIMVCNEICIPDKVRLSLALKAASHTP